MVGIFARLLTMKEVIEYIGVPRSTIYTWMSLGKFPHPIKLGERMARWDKEDLHKWIEERKGE